MQILYLQFYYGIQAKIYIIYIILNIIVKKIKNMIKSEKNIKKTNLIFSFDKKEKKRRKKERKKERKKGKK